MHLLIKRVGIFAAGLALFLSIASISFAGNPPDAGHSSFSANPTSVPNDGSTTSSIQITLRDSSGNSLSGDSVSLIAPSDGNASFSPSSASLDGSGNATFTVHSTNAATDSINVVDNTTGTTLSSFGSVIFTSGSPTPTPTPTCNNSVPSTPTLTKAAASGTNGISLAWTAPTTGNVSYYLVSYGTATTQYVYGNPNVGNVTSYSVGSLSSGKTYYFAVKAVDGCGDPGGYSNEMSATVGAIAAAAPTTAVDSSSDSSDSTDQPTDTPYPTDTPAPSVTDTPTPGPSIFAGISDNKEPIAIGFLVVLAAGTLFFYWKPEAKNKILKIFKRKKAE